MAKQISLIAALVVLVASADAILNGNVSPLKPYYARITFRLTEGNQQEIHNKAGVIIADRFVLTTGFFFGSSWDFRVWVGSNVRSLQEQYVGVGMMRVSTHPDGPAIVQLTTPLVFSQTIQSIRMIPHNSLIGSANEQGMILGLGGSTPATRENLQAAFMRIVPSASCTISYPDRDSNAYFCAFDSVGRGDFCPEDRGSALTVLSRGQEYLVGIAIEGVCNNAPHARPSLFANIGHFRTRINEIIDGIQGSQIAL